MKRILRASYGLTGDCRVSVPTGEELSMPFCAIFGPETQDV